MSAPAACPFPPAQQAVPDPAVHVAEPSVLGDPFRLTRLPVLSVRHRVDPGIPGPIGLPVVGDAVRLARDPFEYVRKATHRYGDIFRVPIPGFDLVVCNHPDLVPEVLNRTDTYSAGSLPKTVTKRFGRPLLFVDDADEYAQRRKMYTPMFGKRYMSTLADDFVNGMVTQLATWEEFVDTGRVIQLEHELARVLLPVFLRNMFSTAFTDEEIDIFDEDVHQILGSVMDVLVGRPPLLLPLPGVPNPVTSLHRSHKRVADLVTARIHDPMKRGDLLQVLVDAGGPDGSGVSLVDRIADVLLFLGAGYDTVATALSWLFALLPTNATAQQHLFDEIDGLGGRPPGADDLSNLTWSRQCFDEAQRLQGGPFLPRVCKTSTLLGGYHIPRGAIVGVSLTNLHRDPRWWAEPDAFDPLHFDRNQVAARPQHAFIPFGAGLRQCVGMAMAYQNALLMTTLILQRYRIHLQPGWTPQHQWRGIIPVKGGVPCTVTRR